jgi:vitamin B12 transporter
MNFHVEEETMPKYYNSLLCISLLAVCTPAAAQQDDAPPTMMDEVVVTESRIEERKRDVSANITTITREDIEQSASRDLGSLLAERGLGHVQKYPGSLTSIGVRGFRTDSHGNDLQGKVLILLDGRRAGTGNATKILTENIERVEVIRGPGSVQYGSAGIGGVINVITRKGTDNSAYVRGGGGSFGRLEAAVGGTALTKGFDFAGALSYLTYDDYDTGGGDTFANTGIDGQYGVSLQGGYTFSERHRLGLIFTGFDVDHAGSPGYLSVNDLDDYSDKSNYSLDARYTGATESGAYQWMARYFFGKDKDKWYNPTASNPDFWDTGIPSERTTDQQGAQAQITGLFGMHTLTAGFDWVDYKVESSFSPQDSIYHNPALFLLGKGSYLNDSLIVSFGMRYDWFKVEVKEPRGREENQTNWAPKIGIAWLPMDNLKLRAQYAKGFMMPSADQLAIDSTAFGRRTVGNPNLDPESSNTYEVGADYFQSGFDGSLTYFHTDFKDKIVTDFLSDGSQSWINSGDATIAGFEIELGYDLGVPMGWQWEVRPYVNATLLTKLEDEETGEDLLYIPDTSLATGISISNGMGTFGRFNVAYYSSQDVQDWESGAFPAPIVSLDGFTVADLVGAYRFYENPTYGAFTLRGEINNIFDEEYSYVKGYPMPGINFYLGLRWDF